MFKTANRVTEFTGKQFVKAAMFTDSLTATLTNGMLVGEVSSQGYLHDTLKERGITMSDVFKHRRELEAASLGPVAVVKLKS